LDAHLSRQRMGLIDLILCEVLQGIHDEEEFGRVKGDLLKFQVFHSGGSRIALAAAQNYRELRRRGYTVRKTIDCLIATLCLQTKQELLHRDHDFDCFEKALGLDGRGPTSRRWLWTGDGDNLALGVQTRASKRGPHSCSQQGMRLCGPWIDAGVPLRPGRPCQ